MKNLRMLFFVTLLLSITACDGDSLELLKVVIEDDNLNYGETLELDISATDGDGIASITIEIPVFSANMVIENPSESNKMDVIESFLVKEENESGTHIVTVTVTDNDGNKKVDTADFTID